MFYINTANLHTKNLVCTLILACVLAGACLPAQAHVDDLSAIAVFQVLPFQLLDSLPTVLLDQERQQLARYGISDNWHVLRSGKNILEIRALESEETLRLCLYRSELGIVAALGLDLGPLCSSELWFIDLDSLASPLSLPAQPRAREFFDLPGDLARDIRASATFCPHPEGLEARPMFWSTSGRQEISPDFSIFYFWNGRYFSKRQVDLRTQEAGS